MVQTKPCDAAELRTLFLFEKLTDAQLGWLCERGRIEMYETGQLIAEGDPATCFFVLIDGSLSMTRRVGNEDVEINRTDQRGVYVGAWASYLGERSSQRYNATVLVHRPSRFFVLSADDFAAAVRDWFPMAVHLLEGLFLGAQQRESTVGQRERLLALGSLSAGLTHELNNPAAAAVRATSSLRDRVMHMRNKLATIAGGAWDRHQLETLIQLQQRAAEQVAKAPDLSPLEASDREDALSAWFDDRGIRDGFQLAPTFVQSGIDVGWLEQVAATVDEAMLEGAVRWLNYTLETELLMNEIEDSTTRISTLVAAAKQYSQMDRAPYQVLDVHELLDSTLVMLSRKITPDVQVVKDYDRSLPQIPVYGAELNQVWTNLIDNALQAMDGAGTLTVRTTRVPDQPMIDVEIGDTGPGIPAEIVTRIYEPFFTTKPVGEGTGLGLDISWRIVVKKHHGDLSVQSRPGETTFRVRLPIEGPATVTALVTPGDAIGGDAA
ncbi:MAG TPA: ATP-binding protein [Jatrophihabitans sp.]|jgi:signal transduction histidine kinase|uniref:ATP-binding protein n=1 Tax=Jatrophihabitans sp. TaxID=1932789 RepID=UPI002DFFEFBF|nr:ATP-binding protein [Jatrophihabitans sp.]